MMERILRLGRKKNLRKRLKVKEKYKKKVRKLVYPLKKSKMRKNRGRSLKASEFSLYLVNFVRRKTFKSSKFNLDKK